MIFRRSRQRYQSLILQRAGVGARNEFGEYEEGGIENIDIVGAVDPIDVNGLQKLRQNTEGGQRIVHGIEVFIDASDLDDVMPVRTMTMSSAPDKIIWNNEMFIIASIADYSSDSHYEITAVRLDQQ